MKKDTLFINNIVDKKTVNNLHFHWLHLVNNSHLHHHYIRVDVYIYFHKLQYL
jgi:hypothetical protein